MALAAKSETTPNNDLVDKMTALTEAISNVSLSRAVTHSRKSARRLAVSA